MKNVFPAIALLVSIFSAPVFAEEDDAFSRTVELAHEYVKEYIPVVGDYIVPQLGVPIFRYPNGFALMGCKYEIDHLQNGTINVTTLYPVFIGGAQDMKRVCLTDIPARFVFWAMDKEAEAIDILKNEGVEVYQFKPDGVSAIWFLHSTKILYNNFKARKFCFLVFFLYNRRVCATLDCVIVGKVVQVLSYLKFN